MELQNHLALLLECQEKQDSSIKHEWLLNTRAEAVRLANYLRGYGFEVENKIRYVCDIPFYYVGVPFKSLQKSTK